MINKGSPVSEHEWLYRRTFRSPTYIYPDGKATSRAFKLRKQKNEKELSVDAKSLSTYELSVIDESRFALFEIENRIVVGFSLTTIHDPVENNPAHCLIIGMDMDDDTLPKALAENSRPESRNS